MNKVVIASKNPVKIRAARGGFESMFPEEDWTFEGVQVPSDVADQPVSDADTRQGAHNRARNAQSKRPRARFWVGMEGGIADDGEGMIAFAWMVVRDDSLVGEARTATFQLPSEVARLVRAGYELGHADDLVFQQDNSKQQDGAVGLLTDGLIDRADYYQHAVVLALIPFKKRTYYPPGIPAA